MRVENSGARGGEACAFPYYYPDCQLMRKVEECRRDPNIAKELHTECFTTDTDIPWCYTKAYQNRYRVEHYHWSRSLQILCSDWLNTNGRGPSLDVADASYL